MTTAADTTTASVDTEVDDTADTDRRAVGAAYADFLLETLWDTFNEAGFRPSLRLAQEYFSILGVDVKNEEVLIVVDTFVANVADLFGNFIDDVARLGIAQLGA